MKNVRISLLALGVATVGILVPATGASAGDLGGWSEQQGLVSNQGLQDRLAQSSLGATLAASVKHTGQAENKVINGTSHKRSHGWTTWSGVYHYTTARLEHYWPSSGVIATSGRQWGTSGTEAVTVWKAFNPNAASNGNGAAKTYYGR